MDQQSYQLMRSQLYIGAAFYDALNPPATNPQIQTTFTLSGKMARKPACTLPWQPSLNSSHWTVPGKPYPTSSRRKSLPQVLNNG